MRGNIKVENPSVSGAGRCGFRRKRGAGALWARVSTQIVRNKMTERVPCAMCRDLLGPKWMLDRAIRTSHVECARIILENCCSARDYVAENTRSLEPVIHRHRNQEMLALLLSYGADPNAGDMPLCVAAWEGSLGCVRQLLLAKANPNPGGTPESQPFFIAMTAGNIECAHELLDAGAVRIRDAGYQKRFVYNDHMDARQRCIAAARTLCGILRKRCRMGLGHMPKEIAAKVWVPVWRTRRDKDLWPRRK